MAFASMSTVDGMNNSLQSDVSAVRCTACSVSQQQFQAVLSISIIPKMNSYCAQKKPAACHYRLGT